MSTIPPRIETELAREVAKKIAENERRNLERALAVKLHGKSTGPLRDTTADKSGFMEKFNAEQEKQEALSCARGIAFALLITAAVAIVVWLGLQTP